MEEPRIEGTEAKLLDARLSRRALLGMGVMGAAVLALPAPLRAAVTRRQGERALRFVHTHTGESGRIVFWANGLYVPDGQAQLDRLLRDHYSDAVHRIDPGLLQLLYRLNGALGTSEPFHVISAYRSPEVNARLAARSGGVAKHSLHTQAKAIDIRVPGRDLTTLRKAALALGGGGVGFYPKSNFVHVDVGRVRRW